MESDIVDVQTHDCKDFGPTSTYIAGTIPNIPEIKSKYGTIHWRSIGMHVIVSDDNLAGHLSHTSFIAWYTT